MSLKSGDRLSCKRVEFKHKLGHLIDLILQSFFKDGFHDATYYKNMGEEWVYEARIGKKSKSMPYDEWMDWRTSDGVEVTAWRPQWRVNNIRLLQNIKKTTGLGYDNIGVFWYQLTIQLISLIFPKIKWYGWTDMNPKAYMKWWCSELHKYVTQGDNWFKETTRINKNEYKCLGIIKWSKK